MKAANAKPRRFVRELRLRREVAEVPGRPGAGGPKDVFADNTAIDVEGMSKEQGYQGVIKRHNMAGMTRSHGTHEYFRHGGSIGCRLTPQRVHKGKRMARPDGQREGQRSRTSSCSGSSVEENCILVRGSIRAAPNDYVVVTKAATRTAYKAQGQGKEEVRSRTRSRRRRTAAFATGAPARS